MLNAGSTAIQGASACINPLTALGFVETMRREKHKALANTAAASNLGQMLVRICKQDGIPLVNVVRSAAQRDLLMGLGATHVCDSSAPSFLADLTEAFAETGVTLAFDAIAGGAMPGQLLACMEAALSRKVTAYSRYGSPTHKQVYVYGGLDPRPTELHRTFGLAWGLGGWLLTPFLLSLKPAQVAALRQRIADELTTTFASPHTKTVSLAGALRLTAVKEYARRATGSKYLIVPDRGGLETPGSPDPSGEGTASATRSHSGVRHAPVDGRPFPSERSTMTAPPPPKGPIKGHTFTVKQPISKMANGIFYVCAKCKVEVLVRRTS